MNTIKDSEVWVIQYNRSDFSIAAVFVPQKILLLLRF